MLLPMEQLSLVLSRGGEAGMTPGGLPAPLLTVHRDERLARVYSPWESLLSSGRKANSN